MDSKGYKWIDYNEYRFREVFFIKLDLEKIDSMSVSAEIKRFMKFIKLRPTQTKLICGYKLTKEEQELLDGQ